jgi:hypothetical protein
LATIGGHPLAEFFTMTNCAETARTPDERQLVDIASILAAGILRLRERDSLPESQQAGNLAESSADRLELSVENVLTVVHGG